MDLPKRGHSPARSSMMVRSSPNAAASAAVKTRVGNGPDLGSAALRSGSAAADRNRA